MLSIINRVWFLYASVSIFVLGRGIMGSYIPIRADIEGFSITLIGILQGTTFLGIALGSMLTLRMIQSVGHVRTFGVCAALVSIGPLIQAMDVYIYSWIFAQIIFGYGTAGMYIVIEAWLNHASPNEHRGKVFSAYSLIIVAVYALSPLIINMVEQKSNALFLLASIITSLAFLPVALVARESPEQEYSERISLKNLYNRSSYGVRGILLCMFTIGVFNSVFIVYVTNMGFDVKYALLSMFVFGIGSAVFTYPLGWISDRMDRRRVISFSSLLASIGFAGTIYAGLLKDSSILLGSVFIIGAFMAPLHPLITSHINDRLKTHEMSSVAAWLVLGFAMMGGLGTIVTGIIMDFVGYFVLPWLLMCMLFGNALYCVYAIRSRPAVSEELRGDFVNVTTMTTTSLQQGVFDSDEETQQQEFNTENSEKQLDST